jgi:tetratricopeptide (TPR) repeat protein
MKLRQFARIVVPSVILLASAAAGSCAELTPDAQQAVNKGILAAQQQDYLLAIRYFADARKISPKAPEIYYDLGLAESKIAGRELRAIAWLAAYVAANPSAPNVDAVKSEIDALDVKSQSNLSRLIRSVQDAAGQTGSDQEFYLGQVAGLWTAASTVRPAVAAVTASDWLGELDEDYGDCPLNTDLFLDFAGYLKTLHSDNPQNLFSALRTTAEKSIDAQNVIDRMLKRQFAHATHP